MRFRTEIKTYVVRADWWPEPDEPVAAVRIFARKELNTPWFSVLRYNNPEGDMFTISGKQLQERLCVVTAGVLRQAEAMFQDGMNYRLEAITEAQYDSYAELELFPCL